MKVLLSDFAAELSLLKELGVVVDEDAEVILTLLLTEVADELSILEELEVVTNAEAEGTMLPTEGDAEAPLLLVFENAAAEGIMTWLLTEVVDELILLLVLEDISKCEVDGVVTMLPTKVTGVVSALLLFEVLDPLGAKGVVASDADEVNSVLVLESVGEAE